MKRKFTILAAAFALLAFLAIPMGMRGQTRTEVTWNASQQGYSNQQAVTDITFNDDISGVFAKGTGSTAPAYYTTGTGVRMYGNNTLTITASNATMSSIVFTYSQNNKNLVVDNGTYTQNTGTWTGSASSVTFTAESGSGHNRIQAIEVTYTISGDTPIVATPTFNPASGTEFGNEGLQVSISCETEGVDLYYTLDGSEPDDESNP